MARDARTRSASPLATRRLDASDAAALDWGAAEVAPPDRGRAWIAIAVLVAVGITVGAATAWALHPAAGATVVLAYCVLVAWWISTQGTRVLRSLSATPIDPELEPRLSSLVHGLAPVVGVTPPSLWLIPDEAANALVCWRGGPVLAVTEGLRESYSRTELEAVVAHCLVRIALGHAKLAGVAVALGPLGRSIAPRVGYQDDVRAAALTRYPPALVAAIRKARPRRERSGPMWFVAEDASHRSIEGRIAEVRDL